MATQPNEGAPSGAPLDALWPTTAFDETPTVECATAEELLAELYPSHVRWRGAPQNWAFRGQADADWRLWPSAYRDAAWSKFPEENAKRKKHRGFVGQWSAEVGIYLNFETQADHAGLELPEDSQVRRNPHTIGSVVPFKEGFWWPPGPFLSVLALAQHYGAPTRLLDWSWSGRVATYFAALPAAEALRGDCPTQYVSDRLAVWAIHAGFVRALATLGEKDAEPEINMVTAPYASNPNLRAQSGLFTVDREVHHNRPFDAAIAEKKQSAKVPTWLPSDPLLKFTLPHSQVPAVLRLLAWEGIHAATMLPGHRGAVLAMAERRLWDRFSEET